MYIPGHIALSTHAPLYETNPSEQKHPSAHPLGQLVASLLSHV